jgi:raffinose/stachyose/melibiose transport system permease protein
MGEKSRQRLSNGIVGAILWVGTLFIIMPLAILVLTSLKSKKESQIVTFSLPEVFHFENYLIAWKQGFIAEGFINSVLITLPTVALILFTAALMGYYLSRRKQKSTSFWYTFVVAGIIRPTPLITTFIFLQQIKLLNTRPGLILVLAATYLSLSTFIYTGFIKGIPRELDEAAAIDGCGPFRTFWQVIFPLLKSCTFTVFIIMMFYVWNNAQESLFFLGNTDYWTMPLNLYRFFGYYRTEWNYVFCAMFLMTLPVFVSYLFGQRFIIDGMIAGSVKG